VQHADLAAELVGQGGTGVSVDGVFAVPSVNRMRSPFLNTAEVG